MNLGALAVSGRFAVGWARWIVLCAKCSAAPAAAPRQTAQLHRVRAIGGAGRAYRIVGRAVSGGVWLGHRGDACRWLSGRVGTVTPASAGTAPGGHTGGVPLFAAEARAEGLRVLTRDPARAAVFCGIDGTLAPGVDRADDAQPPRPVSRLLGALGRRCARPARLSASPPPVPPSRPR